MTLALHRTRVTRRHVLGMAGAVSATVLLAGCGSDSDRASTARHDETALLPADYASRFAEFTVAEEPEGDLTKVVWPDFVVMSPPDIKELYGFHVTSGGLMRYMPCFCGCKGSDHRNNRDCYIQAVHQDGSVTFDPMAPT